MRQSYPSLFDHLNKFYTVFNGCCNDSCQTQCCSEGLSIAEDEERLYIDASLPGIKSDEIKVTLDPRTRQLLISGEGKHEREKAKYLLKSCLNYNYEIPLSNEVNLDQPIDAVSKDGILSITLSKNRGHKPLKIEVKPS
ncbi:MAG: Hsp20/alpha crystallin family protein [Verrucomicrobia bacterium]|nr:Hsp20/alpha crystallin family protein [Verrucomicrobiota bacterium]